MATEFKITKEGRYIKLTTRKLKRKIKQVGVYTIPSVPIQTSSFLQLSLIVADSSGRKSILIEATAAFPGTSLTRWSLQHFAHQSVVRPDIDSPWIGVPVTEVYVSAPSPASDFPFPKTLTIWDEALPLATHRFRLKRTDGNAISFLPEEWIQTPIDTVYRDITMFFNMDIITRGSNKMIFNSLLADLLSELRLDHELAKEWDVNIENYEAAVNNLVMWLEGHKPSIYDIEVDTPLGEGGGKHLQMLWDAVRAARELFYRELDVARMKGMELMLGDDRISPGEKRVTKATFDNILEIQEELRLAAGLFVEKYPILKDAFGNYSNAVKELFDFLASLTDSTRDDERVWSTVKLDWMTYSYTSYIGRGNGAKLWALIQACRFAETLLRQAINDVTFRTIIDLSDEDILSQFEKPFAIREYEDIQGKLNYYKRMSVGFHDENKVYYARLLGAVAELDDYLNNILPSIDYPVPGNRNPAWNNTLYDTRLIPLTPDGAGRAMWRRLWRAIWDAMDLLDISMGAGLFEDWLHPLFKEMIYIPRYAGYLNRYNAISDENANPDNANRLWIQLKAQWTEFNNYLNSLSTARFSENPPGWVSGRQPAWDEIGDATDAYSTYLRVLGYDGYVKWNEMWNMIDAYLDALDHLGDNPDWLNPQEKLNHWIPLYAEYENRFLLASNKNNIVAEDYWQVANPNVTAPSSSASFSALSTAWQSFMSYLNSLSTAQVVPPAGWTSGSQPAWNNYGDGRSQAYATYLRVLGYDGRRTWLSRWQTIDNQLTTFELNWAAVNEIRTQNIRGYLQSMLQIAPRSVFRMPVNVPNFDYPNGCFVWLTQPDGENPPGMYELVNGQWIQRADIPEVTVTRTLLAENVVGNNSMFVQTFIKQEIRSNDYRWGHFAPNTLRGSNAEAAYNAASTTGNEATFRPSKLFYDPSDRVATNINFPTGILGSRRPDVGQYVFARGWSISSDLFEVELVNYPEGDARRKAQVQAEFGGNVSIAGKLSADLMDQMDFRLQNSCIHMRGFNVTTSGMTTANVTTIYPPEAVQEKILESNPGGGVRIGRAGLYQIDAQSPFNFGFGEGTTSTDASLELLGGGVVLARTFNKWRIARDGANYAHSGAATTGGNTLSCIASLEKGDVVYIRGSGPNFSTTTLRDGRINRAYGANDVSNLRYASFLTVKAIYLEPTQTHSSGIPSLPPEGVEPPPDQNDNIISPPGTGGQTLEETLASINTRLTTMNTSITNLSSSITALSARVTALENA